MAGAQKVTAATLRHAWSKTSFRVKTDANDDVAQRNLLDIVVSSLFPDPLQATGGIEAHSLQPNSIEQRNTETRVEPLPFDNDSATIGANDGQLASNDSSLSEALLGLLRMGSDQPRMTEEELEREQATLTEEERVSALSDTLGTKCTISRHHKKARQDLDRESVSFLLQQMRLEIEQMPLNKKRALVEAQRKCHPEEFSDERFKSFLRCEGMNTEVRSRVRKFALENYSCLIQYLFYH